MKLRLGLCSAGGEHVSTTSKLCLKESCKTVTRDDGGRLPAVSAAVRRPRSLKSVEWGRQRMSKEYEWRRSSWLVKWIEKTFSWCAAWWLSWEDEVDLHLNWYKLVGVCSKESCCTINKLMKTKLFKCYVPEKSVHFFHALLNIVPTFLDDLKNRAAKYDDTKKVAEGMK